MLEFATHHKILTGAGLLLGGFFVVRAIKSPATEQPTDDYNGPSIIAGPGPVVTGMAAGGNSPATVSPDLAKIVEAEVLKMRASANVATMASGTATNADLVAGFLAKINPGKMAGQQINFGYNENGQITHFDFGKSLAPQTELQKAQEKAAINAIEENSLLSKIAKGFALPAGVFSEQFTNYFTAAKDIANKAGLVNAQTNANVGILKNTVNQNASLTNTKTNAAAGIKINSINKAASVTQTAIKNQIKTSQLKLKAAAVGR